MKHETPPQTKTKTSSSSFMNCFQHTLGYTHRGHAVPCTTPAGEHHTNKAFLHKHALTGFTTHAYSFKRLALLRLPHTSPFSA